LAQDGESDTRTLQIIGDESWQGRLSEVLDADK